ncbi:fructosamine kinase [Gracilibacillus halophilus YIM-C55.5]|uniref:Fructosamine kinase n=1 Tax=Gracilibacillus halophilus YIM-C55.5 TaxID=1308866 RepID=N4WX72_9BACI|nr:fructosamine kinase family protein [Gracilibacillus halophilus]ENH97671.1 fructosamine kinase [Gracilibacillus halophilus YIM-C55.5]
MKALIAEKLRHIGDESSIISIQPIAGGDINQAYYVETAKEIYFIKANRNVPQNFFQAEAEGLQRIQETNTIHVPNVYHYDNTSNTDMQVLILEWIEGKSHANTARQLGENLARLHSAEVGEKYGFNQTTFVGELTQNNQFHSSWTSYYRDQRLIPQFERALEKGRMPQKRKKQMESLFEKMEHLVPQHPGVSLLHGDLWGGNWIVGPKGTPYVIDPSVLYGDRAFEIAFTELFGGFPRDFYQAYQEHLRLPDDYQDVKPLYQLFYLLVHLNLFGEAYGSAVDRILGYYV